MPFSASSVSKSKSPKSRRATVRMARLSSTIRQWVMVNVLPKHGPVPCVWNSNAAGPGGGHHAEITGLKVNVDLSARCQLYRAVLHTDDQTGIYGAGQAMGKKRLDGAGVQGAGRRLT